MAESKASRLSRRVLGVWEALIASWPSTSQTTSFEKAASSKAWGQGETG